jgi:hypothetical protein
MRPNLNVIINEDDDQIVQLSAIALSASKRAQSEAIKSGNNFVTAIDGKILETEPNGSIVTIKIIQNQNTKINNQEKIVKFKFK